MAWSKLVNRIDALEDEVVALKAVVEENRRVNNLRGRMIVALAKDLGYVFEWSAPSPQRCIARLRTNKVAEKESE